MNTHDLSVGTLINIKSAVWLNADSKGNPYDGGWGTFDDLVLVEIIRHSDSASMPYYVSVVDYDSFKTRYEHKFMTALSSTFYVSYVDIDSVYTHMNYKLKSRFRF
jgi:hypothetical protein